MLFIKAMFSIKLPVLLLVVFGLATQPLSAREPTALDYVIWSAVVDGGATGDLYVWHRVEPVSWFAWGFEQRVRKFFPDATFTAAAWAGEAAELSLDRFITDTPVKLLHRKDLKTAVGRVPKSSWVISPSLIPGADRIHRLSWPAYSDDGRVAYVLAGNFNEYKGSIVLNRIEKNEAGDWSVRQTVSHDLLLWGKGWPSGGDDRLFIEE